MIPRATGADFQYSGFIISSPKNPQIEDELFAILNSKVNFFPRPKEEILDIINLNEFNSLYEKLDSEILKKIGGSLEKDDIFIGKVVQNDLINDITYMGVYLDEWSITKNRVTKSIYADGLIEDRRPFFNNTIFIFFILFLSSLLIPFFQSLLFKIKRKNFDANILHWTSAFTFLAAIPLHYFIIKFLVLLAPAPDSLAILPISRIWILVFHLFIILGPIIIIYFISILTPKLKEKIHDRETLASTLAGIGLGTLFIFSGLYNLKFSNNDIILYQICMVILFIIYSCWVSDYLSNAIMEDNYVLSLPFLSYIIILFINTYSIMTNNFLLIYYSILIMISFPAIFILYHHYSKKEIIKENDKEFSKKISIKNLHENINSPPLFIDPSANNDFISKTANIFFDTNDKINILLISGEQGSGKTRIANEIGYAIINRYNKDNSTSYKKWILFGDCDELNKEGSGVPFEPFSQALHEILGAGRFEPPSKKADKIKKGLSNAGLNTVLDASGLGILNSLMGSSGEDVGSASISEMTHIVVQTLLGLSKERPVVFIIDDLHWIDNISFKLFKGILDENKLINKNIYFILTTRNNINNENDFKGYLTANNNIELKQLTSENFIINQKFKELLESLNIASKSVSRYLKYITDYDISNTLTVLQSLNQLIDNDAIEIKNNQFQIKNNFKLNSLEPPLNIITVIKEQLKSISDDQFQIVKFAAFIGSEFKASVLSEALKMRRLLVLNDLEELEKKDIIIDVKNQDDVYKFKSNAIINVVRYMYRVSTTDADEIPQLVREYHFRIADSIEKNMQNKNITVDNMTNENIYNLAKRSWASGDRMINKAFIYNFEAQKRAYLNDRFEESIQYGKNLIDIINKLDYSKFIDDVVRFYLLISQAKINIDYPSKEIDENIEQTKLIVNKIKKENQNKWMIKVLNIEADAFIHDHSNYFYDQKDEILDQLNLALNGKEKICLFDKVYAELSILRINNEIDQSEVLDKLKKLFKTIENIEIDKINNTDSPISAFSNNSFIDFEKLKSELLEQKIDIMMKNENNVDETLNVLYECIKIKEHKDINDKEGLAQAYSNLGKIYSNSDNTKSILYIEKAMNLASQIGNKYLENKNAESLKKLKGDNDE